MRLVDLLVILLLMVRAVYSTSPVFVSDDMKTIKKINTPTHAWSYYASNFLIDVFEHTYKADYEEGQMMKVQYFTQRNDVTDPPCFHFVIIEETTDKGYHLINIAIKHTKSSLYCTTPFFDPYSVSSYNLHETWNRTATNRTRVVIFVEHEQKPYVLAVGNEEGIDLLDWLGFTYNKVRIQLWSGYFSLPWVMVITHALAVMVWFVLGKTEWSSLFILFALASYVGNLADMLYNYIRIEGLEMSHCPNLLPCIPSEKIGMDFGVYAWMHIFTPLVFLVLLSVYFWIREDRTVCAWHIGYWLSVHSSVDALALAIIGLASFSSFQAGACLAAFWIFCLVGVEVMLTRQYKYTFK